MRKCVEIRRFSLASGANMLSDESLQARLLVKFPTIHYTDHMNISLQHGLATSQSGFKKRSKIEDEA